MNMLLERCCAGQGQRFVWVKVSWVRQCYACPDGVASTCHMRGKIRRRMSIGDSDWVFITSLDLQSYETVSFIDIFLVMWKKSNQTFT